MATPAGCPEGKQLWLIHCVDDDSSPLEDGETFGGSGKRMAVYAEHKVYQGATANPENPEYIRKLAAGPLLTDEGTHMIGSTFIVESTKEEAIAFNENDPFAKAGVWKSVNISRYVSIPAGLIAHAGK
eukprot:CAMPEP_0113943640 /NCGR_PEP_ID=MMETSP1339-20121228/26946_1 /TAXON_ID=94617 /ORGANISM="Fibrocapsa japonica" /LENGTH=127 /DNA_ID=CAMNT_0000948577 /DNA_START=119 /DNA_END=502 /DNA_ORIENTATION=+ /assembly_acc=CAM_ASM_000762